MRLRELSRTYADAIESAPLRVCPGIREETI